MLLSAMTAALDGLGAVDGRLGGADRFQRLIQDRLVGFDLGDQDISGLASGFKSFF
jgi:hypothetical protein